MYLNRQDTPRKSHKPCNTQAVVKLIIAAPYSSIDLNYCWAYGKLICSDVIFPLCLSSQRTCRSFRSALADVLYSILPCVCRSTGRLWDPARTDVSSCLNMAHRHWTERQTEVEWGEGGGKKRETDYNSVQVPPLSKATLRSALAYAPVGPSESKLDKWFCM